MAQAVPNQFKAFRIHDDEQGYRAMVETISVADQNAGDVVIKAAWSGINFKDALAATGKGKILRTFPMSGGIDVAGTVVESSSDRFKPGDPILVTGSGLSETRDGGFAEYLRLDSNWIIPLPTGLSAREAMTIGTAGFTAALSLHRMELAGQSPDQGPVLVTGATGGVGSIAIDILASAGYEVHAVSGKPEQYDYLKGLGASECISREEVMGSGKPLDSARWAGCIDSVGGDMLASICTQVKPWGNIAACGLAGGIKLNTTVMPFIIRGVSLIGIDSPTCPYAIREIIWNKLAGDWKPRHLDAIATKEVGLDGIAGVLDGMLAGGSVGRTLVKLWD
ncbi:MAG: oxidoreductase [Xanthomonadales bacterium]|nr:oxidoreductase [Xanthomonadales bacterium]